MYDDLRISYTVMNAPAVQLGAMVVNQQLIADATVQLVLKSFNRHGLIAGATGSGKTKTIQVLSEQLSLAGVPSLVMDIKGDLSGLAMPGVATDALKVRSESLHMGFVPRGFPVEFLTLSEAQSAVPLRATVDSFGSVLFSRMLDVNDTQEGVVTALFQYARQEHLPLVDLADIKSLLQYAQTEEGKAKISADFGAIASSSTGAIMRKIIELEAQGGAEFFGEPAFNVMDLVRTDAQGRGVISILRLLDMQDKPKLFSTFMLKLLSDVYRLMPELGDPEQPRLVLFIDEAHLIFSHASKALLSLLDTIVKLIRSKGIGILFCTQTPNDIPDNILSQLGLKIQHALRAFTAKDRTAMKLVAQNFPISAYYNTEQLLTSLGIGEALVSGLNAKGEPTPLVQCMMRAPESRMGVVTDLELQQIVASSALYARYGQRQSRHSAKEILATQKAAPVAEKTSAKESPESGALDLMKSVTKNTLFRQIIRQLVRDGTRALMSALGIKK